MKKHTHLGVYGVITKNTSMLCIKKSRGPYIGTFDLPGGRIEFGESPLEALEREIMEEVGITFQAADLHDTMTNLVTYTNSDGDGETLHHIGIIYIVTLPAGDTQLKTTQGGEDSLGALWVDMLFAV